MSSLKTTNLNMHKWEPTDPVQRTEFNENFQKIDEHSQSVTTQLVDNAKIRHISLNDPKYGIKGDGTDEIVKIKQAFNDAMTEGKSIDLGVATVKYAFSSSIVIDRPLTIYSNGAKSIFEQLSWGVPCLEIRSPDVNIIGTFKAEVNKPRIVFDSTTLTNSPNTSAVKSEVASYPREAGSAIYCRGSFDRLNIGTLDLKGFITGLYFGGSLQNLPENININSVIVENVDFGVLGNGFRNLNIGVIQAKNILRSQGVDEHALYFAESTTRGEGVYIGAVLCNGIETATSHIITIKSVNNYHIGLIKGENVGAFFTSRLAKGYISDIQGIANKGENLGNAIFIQDAGAECVIGNINITSEANWIDAANRGWGVAVTGGADAVINNLKIKMTAAIPSNAIYTSGGGKVIINNPEIHYVNTQTQPAILITTSGNTIINNPELNGGSLLVTKQSTAKYELTVDPNKIKGGTNINSIVCQDDIFNTTFTAFNKTAYVEANAQPQPSIRSYNVIKTNNLSARTITNFRHGTNGQEFYVIAGDIYTTIEHNVNTVLKGGVNLTPANWKVVKFVWMDGKAYQI